MKKLLILSLLAITLLNNGCNKKSTETSASENNSSAIKCPHCGSTNLSNAEPGGRILECNACGVGFSNY
jgi:ribosomal protein L37AE/L43A